MPVEMFLKGGFAICSESFRNTSLFLILYFFKKIKIIGVGVGPQVVDTDSIYSEKVGKGLQGQHNISIPEAIWSRILCQAPVLVAEMKHKSGLG